MTSHMQAASLISLVPAGQAQVLIVHSPAAARLLEAYSELKFRLIASLLWLAGRRTLATKVYDAWKVGCQGALFNCLPTHGWLHER